MKANTKRAPRIAAVAFLAALFAAVVMLGAFVMCDSAADEGESNIGRTYYYAELKNSELAQKFYGIMSEMNDKGQFKTGKTEYDLSTALTEAEIADYVDNADPAIPVALGAARDAFFMDHPELFYVDVYKIYLSAGMQNGKYVAFLGTGRADNYYLDKTVTTAAEVDSAVEKFSAAVDKLADDARKASADAVGQIKYVNKYLVENVEYDYGSFEDTTGAGYTFTAYGALVKKLALCDGISKAFKVVMDKLDIPCVIIRGTSYTGNAPAGYDAGVKPHAWNAVKLDGLWYGVDVTYNIGAVYADQYTLVGDDSLSKNHYPDGVISSSGFELKYPALRPFDYGVNEDASGFVFKDSGTGTVTYKYMEADPTTVTYGYAQSKDPLTGEELGYYLTLGVGYNGKNLYELEDEGKYLACRECGKDGVYSNWVSLPEFNRGNNADMFGAADGFTVRTAYASTYRLQFAILDSKPDLNAIEYSAAFAETHLIAMSTVYSNDAAGTFVPSPFAIRKTPSYTGAITSFDTLDITLEYNDDLVYTDKNMTAKDVGVVVTSEHSDIADHVKIENIVWNAAERKLSFRFTPSLRFEHNKEIYHFTPTNLVGKSSGKVPDPAIYSFKRKSVVCPKVFNDGRLYMQVFGTPQFVGAEDMSLDGFKNENGDPIVGNQRSQMMLVVNSPDAAENKEMEDMIPSGDKAAIKKSSTYQIDLQVCGLIQKIPSGSYMQVGFSFPEGFGPDDAGVTFTVYHYTRDAQGKIDTVEEIPCVVTEYGIIATVKSFSPFMICAVDATKKAPTDSQNIYASVTSAGGSIDSTTIKTVDKGGSVSYTLTAENGYKVDRIMLNGKDVSNKLSGNVITLSYSEIVDNNTNSSTAKAGNNILDISFVSERVDAYNTENGIEIRQPQIIVSTADMIQAYVPSDPAPATPTKTPVGLIVGIVAAVVIVLCGAGFAVWFFVFRKKKTATATASASRSKSNASAAASKQPEKPVEKQPAKPSATVNKSTAAAPRQTATPNRPTSGTAQRPTGTTARPTNGTAQRPTGTTARPTSGTAQRPTGTTARPTSGTAQRTPPPRSSSSVPRPTNGNKPDKK